MQDQNTDPALPFLQRNQLNFQSGRTFSLQLLIATQYTGTNITVSGFTKDSPFTISQITTGSSSISPYVFGISDIPVMLSVNDLAGDFSMGDCYVIVQLLVDGTVVTELCSGFVYNNKSVSFPKSNSMDAMPMHGGFVEITGTDTAAGAQINDSIAVNGPIKVHQIKVRLVTDANPANRTVHFKFTKSGGAAFEYISQTVQTASKTVDYILAPFGYQPATLADTIIYVPIPIGIVYAKATGFTSTIDNGQATDNFAAAKYSLEEFTSF